MQCDHFDAGRCRSCTLMGVPYAVQLADKQARAAERLATVAPGIRWLDAMASPESHYRNKAKLVVGGRAGSPTLGILDERGRGVDLRSCGLYEPGLAATFDALHRLVADLRLEPYDVPTRRGELKYLLVTHSPDGEHLVRFVLRSERHLAALREALPRLRAELPSARVVTVNLHPEHKAVLEGDTEVALTDETLLPMRVGAVTLLLGPRAFFQTNTSVAAGLYRQASEWVTDADPEVVWDLYCGVGGFALHAIGPGRTVVGVETSARGGRGRPCRRRTTRGCRGPGIRGNRDVRGRRRDDPDPVPSPGPRRRQPAPARHRARARRLAGHVDRHPTSSTRAATSTPWLATSPRCRRCDR